MRKVSPLPASALRARLDPARIPYDDSCSIPVTSNHRPPQPRALQALELAMNIKDGGYNIFLSGEVNLGRTYMLQDFFRVRLKKLPTPPDLLYIYNFDDEDVPRLLTVPAGQGKRLKSALSALLNRLRKDLPQSFENEAYIHRRSGLVDAFQDKRDKFFWQMDAMANTQGFNLDMDDTGTMTLYPLVEGKRLSDQDFERMNTKQRKDLRTRSDTLTRAMSGLARKLRHIKEDFFEEERTLDRENAAETLDRLMAPVVNKFTSQCDSEILRRHFNEIRTHILDNLDAFRPGSQNPVQEQSGTPPFPTELSPSPDDVLARCEINLFVDNAQTSGAPLHICDHPTPAHLLGCIERKSEMGTLLTDFSLVKAGALHQANGGVLILRMEDLSRYPLAWEGLLRALRGKEARIEDITETDAPKTKGITPESIHLSLKVVLVGTEELYEELLLSDDRFGKLFKIKAQLTEHMPRNKQGTRIYLAHIRRIIDESSLPPFDREALAQLVDAGSFITDDQRKLTLKFSLIRELMIEAAAIASIRGKKIVDGKTLQEAVETRYFRTNLVEEAFLEEYDNNLIKVDTKGEAIGRVNGLSVTGYGDVEFGLPHQIAATVGAGHGGIIDLEREANLGGPIHTKAMLILKSYLVAQFARNKPLILTGSLCFEQNYAGIEGDSASGAELAALLSVLADVPVKLSLAFTGAVSQSGNILAVGGVTRKIEGFFEVCHRHGLTGNQGVIIPKDNIPHLMLKSDVIDAVDAGKFHVYPVEHITQALELLTGLPAGRLRKDGRFTPGSLYGKVDRRLTELTKIGTDKGIRGIRERKQS